MENIKKYISILNWVEPKFTSKELMSFKDKSYELNINKLFNNKKKREDLKRIYSSVERSLYAGFEIICSTSELYPVVLNDVFSCPVPLMFKGEFKLDKFNIGIVGSRKPQLTTNEWLKSELFEALRELKSSGYKLNILSGGAYGVDQEAHKVSLLSEVPTVCFLPTGINDCYPSSLRPLIETIIENNGTIISPFPPSYPIFKSNFYFRNKILVLLSNLVFIAEARRRSGTIMTANMAVSSGKSIIALPQAPIKNCLGSLDLIESGVPLIRCKKDFIFSVQNLIKNN